jgi:7-cyano-7-deazaguanine reductase
METKQPDVSELKGLGSEHTEYFKKVNAGVLETFETPSSNTFYVTFDQEGEFTSLCPVTHQPDFASIRILYKPRKKCVESKSLKLYLFSYRDEGGFGETITNQIADDLYNLLEPDFIVVIGDFRARGGLKWKTEAIKTISRYVWNPLDIIQIEKLR